MDKANAEDSSRADLEFVLRGIWERAFMIYEKSMTEEVPSQSQLNLQVQLTFSVARQCVDIPEDLLLKVIPILANLLCDFDLNDFLSPWRALQEAAVHCLTRIACVGNGKLIPDIASSGAVGYMFKMLYYAQWALLQMNETDDFLRVCLKFVWVSVSLEDGCRDVFYEHDGVRVVLTLLKLRRSYRDSTRRLLLEIVSALAMVPSARELIVARGGLCFLIEAIGIGSMASRERACQAIGLIGANSRQLRHMIPELGAIPLLINLFNEGDSQTKLVAANALGLTLTNLDYIRPAAQAGAIPLYIHLLEEFGLLGNSIAVDALCLLSIAEENAVSAAKHIARILKDSDSYFGKVYACHVLWDIAAYKHSVPVFQYSGVFPALFQLLGDDEFERDKVCSVIAKLSDNKVDRQGLVDQGVIPLLLELLEYESDDDDPMDTIWFERSCAATAIMNFYDDPDCRDKVDEEVDESYLQELKSLNARHLLDSDMYGFEIEHMSEDDEDDSLV